jgi:CDP-glucose 4,6-dehydratase
MGVAHVLDACRRCSSVKAVIVVTSDKCYEDKRQPGPYTEEDALGGHDPYSASKAAAEIVTASYRQSFFPPGSCGDTHFTLVASARAGNVIAGGDWAEARLIPDIVRAAVAGDPVCVRNPESIRPWQHVLDCLAGYLLLGQRLLAGDTTAASAWNFGPDEGPGVSVLGIVERFKSVWTELQVSLEQRADAPHEATVLRLDSSKSHELLHWRSVWNVDDAVNKTVEWYQLFHDKEVVSSSAQLDSYVDRARELGAVWTES